MLQIHSIRKKVSQYQWNTNIIDINNMIMTSCLTCSLVVILDDISVEMPFKIVYLRMES